MLVTEMLYTVIDYIKVGLMSFVCLAKLSRLLKYYFICSLYVTTNYVCYDKTLNTIITNIKFIVDYIRRKKIWIHCNNTDNFFVF